MHHKIYEVKHIVFMMYLADIVILKFVHMIILFRNLHFKPLLK